jgi:hypothetical protein
MSQLGTSSWGSRPAFVFTTYQLNANESVALRSQIATPKEWSWWAGSIQHEFSTCPGVLLRKDAFLITDSMGSSNMSNMRNAVLALTAIHLGGCAVGVKPVYGPDGQQAHAITCSALGRDWSDCFEKAGQICGARGYKVWNQATSESSVISGDQNSIFGGSSESRTLLIGCK